MLNNQPVEKLSNSDLIQVVNCWETVQGEGPFVGTPAVFVRLAGCNLKCKLCDTDYTSSRTAVKPDAVVDMVNCIRQSGLVVITGGEPFRQISLSVLVRQLIKAGYQVQIETNGTLYNHEMPWGAFHVVCSPKAAKINPNLQPHIDALKYVVEADHIDWDDGLPTSVLGTIIRPARPDIVGLLRSDIYLQPADEGNPAANRRNIDAALKSCMKFGYRICLQTHKILGLP